MCANTSNVVRRSILSGLQGYPTFDPDIELFPEARPSAQHFQNSHLSHTCLYRTEPQLVPDPSAARARIGTIPDTSRIQNNTTDWETLDMSQCPFPEASEWNSLTISEDLVMRNHSVLMAPTVPHIGPLGTETLLCQPRMSPFPSLGGFKESTSESLLQASGASPSQECYTLWKRICVEAVVVTGINKFVPQGLYKPSTAADKERYLERISLSSPIVFLTGEPLEWGISLDDVCNGRMHHLVDKDNHVLQNCGPSVSIRINWPGYPPFKCQISSRNWRRTKGPITKGKLAQNLAKATGRFIDKMSNVPLEAGAEVGWKVGPQHIKVQDLILVSLHHVSKGSWQPQFRLRRDVP